MKKAGKALSILFAIILLTGAIGISAMAAPLQFTDVPAGAYFYDAVVWAAENNITNGTSDSEFSPEDTVTRAQAVTFIWRAMGEPSPKSTSSPFSDITNSGLYYYRAVIWAKEQGITNGIEGGKFGPKDTLTYDQIFAMLCRAAGGVSLGSQWSSQAVSWAQSHGIADGISFSAKDACPRSDVVYCLWKQLSNTLSDDTPDKDVQEEDTDNSSKEQDREDGQYTGAADLTGARAALETAFYNLVSSIDVSAYNIESSALEALAADVMNVPGYENYYGITKYWCPEAEGKTAKTLQVWYQNYDLEKLQAQRSAVSRIVSEVISSGMSDYDIAKALHDYLVLNCAYDSRYYTGDIPSVSHTAYGALILGTAVCDGYANAYQALMEAAGVPCQVVTGYARGGHAWNIVQIDGQWYHVDATWDDPTPDKAGYIRYDYFLLSDSAIGKDHSNWKANYSCTSTKYDNADLPSTDEQEEQKEQAEQEAKLQAITDYCLQAAADLPLNTQEQLLAASDDVLRENTYSYIYFDSSQYTSSELIRAFDRTREAMALAYPDYKLTSIDSMSYLINRLDVREEINRRTELATQERNQRVTEICQIIQAAIEGSSTYQIKCPVSGYTFSEIRLAVNTMNKDGYSFGSYTSDDYRITSYSSASVNILNYKFQ